MSGLSEHARQQAKRQRDEDHGIHVSSPFLGGSPGDVLQPMEHWSRHLKVQHVTTASLESAVLREQYKQMQARMTVQLHMLASQCQIQKRQLKELHSQLDAVLVQMQILRNNVYTSRKRQQPSHALSPPFSAVDAATTGRAPAVHDDLPFVDDLLPGDPASVLKSPSLSSPAALAGKTYLLDEPLETWNVFSAGPSI